jgi:hypothetical protein
VFLTYNTDLSYNSNFLTYDGNVRVTISGISNPFEIGNIIVSTLSASNDSNSTVVGLISLDITPSGEVVFISNQPDSVANVSIAVISNSPNANIVVEYI